MTDKNENITGTEQLRKEVRGPVEMLLTRLREDLGEDLLSLCVVGSTLTADFDPKYSDINTVLIVRRRSHQILQTLGGYGKKMGKHKLHAPLLMTPEYISQSADVFGVELLEFQHNHAVVYGTDPFGDLSFSKQDIRLQCERELKSSLINLRQGYIRAMGKNKIVGDLLLQCVSQLAVVLRAMLWLVDTERPTEAMGTLQIAADKFGFDPARLVPIMYLKQRHASPAADQVEEIFESVYQVVDHLSRVVDRIGDNR